MGVYDEILAQTRGREATTRGLAAPGVAQVLREAETPGVFEQFGRVLGRPGFATRSLLTGDIGGALRNTGQFLNEIFLGGMGGLNPNWTLSSALNVLPGVDLPRDFTSAEHRPEFTDLLKRWGMADPRFMGAGEKLGLDIVGGILTDPLSLVGGGPKGIATGAMKSAVALGRPTAQRLAYQGLKEGGGKVLQHALQSNVDEMFHTDLTLRSLQSRFPLLSQFNSGNLETLIDRAAEVGMTPGQASKVVKGVRGRAAERLFFETARKDPSINLAQATRTLVPSGNPLDDLSAFMAPNNPKLLLSVPSAQGIPTPLRAGLQHGEFIRKRFKEFDAGAFRDSYLFVRPQNAHFADRLIARNADLEALYASGRVTPQKLAALHRDMGELYGYSDDAIKSYLRANNLPDSVVTGAGQWQRFLDEIPSEVLDKGLMALRKEGMHAGEGISYFAPWRMEWQSVGWDKIFGLTLPGMIAPLGRGMQAIGLVGPGIKLEQAAGSVAETVKAVWGGVVNKMYSRFSPTQGVSPEAQAIAQKEAWGAQARINGHRDDVERVFGKFDVKGMETFAKVWDVAGENYHRAVNAIDPTQPISAQAVNVLANLPNASLKSLRIAQGLARKLNAGGVNNPADWQRLAVLAQKNPDVAEAVKGIQRKIIAGEQTEWARQTMKQTMDPLLVDEGLNLWTKGMEQVPGYMRFVAKREKDLQRFTPEARAAWETATGDPFYVPHQMSRRLHEALDEGLFDTVTAGKINDVFSDARTYPTRGAFLKRLEGLADELGLSYGDPDELQNLNAAELYFRRMASFELTKARQGLYQRLGKLREKTAGSKSDYEFYINRVLHPMAELDPRTGKVLKGGQGRTNTIGKILGGGRFTVPTMNLASAQAKAAQWKDWAGARAVNLGDGKFGVEFHFPGLNTLFKPLLTSHPLNIKFRVRNLLSGSVMMSFIPGIGQQGFKQIVPAFLNGLMVRTLLKEGPKRALLGPGAPYTQTALESAVNKGDVVTAWVRHLTGTSEAERQAALNVLRSAGARVGHYSVDEVSAAIKLAVGANPISPADLSAGSDLLTKLLPATTQLTPATRTQPTLGLQARDLFRRYVKWGEDLNNDVEARLRITGMLEQLQRGVDPVTAAANVANAMVDYSKNSSVERFVRDTFPFARFSIGSVPWIKTMLEKPGVGGGTIVNLQTLGLAQRSLAGATKDEAGGGQFLPTEAQGSLALPLPWKDAEGNYQFLTSLGLPHEATLQIVGAVPSTDAFRRNVLGSAHPLLRGMAEPVVGKSFFFGTDYGSYRKAPGGALNPFAEKITGQDGKPDRYEVSGMANEIMNLLPTAGAQATVERLVDTRRSFWNKVMVTSTGAKITSVDLAREVKRRVAKYLEDKVQSGQIGEVQAFFTRVDPENIPEDLKIMLQALAQERAEARKRGKK